MPGKTAASGQAAAQCDASYVTGWDTWLNTAWRAPVVKNKATTVKEPCNRYCYTRASADSDILIAKWSDGVQLPIAGVTVGFVRALEAGAGNRKGAGEVAEVFSRLSIRPRFTK